MDYKSTREGYGEGLVELGSLNPKVVVLDADLSGSTRTSLFREAYPDRFFSCGIAELNMAAMAAGMASFGLIPFISTFAVFGAGRAYDAIRSQICYPNLPVKMAFTHAGLTVGEDGATHQMLEDIALMSAIPNMTVWVPADATEARLMTIAAAGAAGPVYIRLGREKQEVIYNSSYVFKPGQPSILRDGEDVTIAACGVMAGKALAAADALSADGIEAAVLNCSSLKPLDPFLIQNYAKRTGAVVTCEEHSLYGGLNAIICQALCATDTAIVEAVAVRDVFGQSGKPDELLTEYGLTVDEIVSAVRRALRRSL